MKKTNILILVISLFALICPSINYAQCVQCDNITYPIDIGHLASELGGSTTASGDYSFSGGYSSTSVGLLSFSFGNQAQALGNYSFAFGPSSLAQHTGSISLGSSIQSLAYQAMVFGHGVLNHPLTANIGNSIIFGNNSDIPTLFISGSNGVGKTGKIGIGNVTDPQAKLHIKSDNLETASLLIESYLPSVSAYLFLGTEDFGLYNSGNGLNFLTDSKYIFNAGDVGIGTSYPTEKLDVNGNIKQRARFHIETEKIQSNSRAGLKLYTNFGTGITIDDRGQVGINKPNPSAALDVDGKIKTKYFQFDNSVPHINSLSVGDVLCSVDTYGNANWISQSSLDDGDWTKQENGDNIYRINGKIGIGTSNIDTDAKLEVVGKIVASNFKLTSINSLGKILQSDATGNATWVNPDWTSNGDNIQRMTGNVGIGIAANNDYKLSVAGNIRATEVMIEHIDDWYDCVFEEDYQLTSLKDVESFVKQNKHLPDVPSEAEVKEKGINVGEMNAILLKKIEELTLHMIKQEKKIEKLQKALGQQ